jgi:hypothetical protein
MAMMSFIHSSSQDPRILKWPTITFTNYAELESCVAVAEFPSSLPLTLASPLVCFYLFIYFGSAFFILNQPCPF